MLEFMESLKFRGILVYVGSNMTAYIRYKKMESTDGKDRNIERILLQKSNGEERTGPGIRAAGRHEQPQKEDFGYGYEP